jgi:hypothetical protein
MHSRRGAFRSETTSDNGRVCWVGTVESSPIAAVALPLGYVQGEAQVVLMETSIEQFSRCSSQVMVISLSFAPACTLFQHSLHPFH